MLYEELSQKFGCQVVEPFKEPVIIVDAKEFKPQWEEQLKSEGCKILVSDFLGRSCFLIRKPQASNNSVNEQPTPQPSQPQNIEEAITELIREGLGFKEIKERLGLSHAQLMGYMSSLRKKGVLNSVGWIPKRRKRKASTREEKNEHAKPSLNTSNLPLREMLEASLKLLDSHPKVVRLLLQKCLEALT
jgi:transposase